MIIVMRADASKSEIDAVSERVKAEGFDTSLVQGTERTIVCVLGDGRPIEQQQFNVMAGVESTTRVLKPFKLSSRIVSSEDSLLKLSNNTIVGSEVVTIIAGPCSVEDRTQMLETAHAVKEAGAQALRGGAFKPRSSPYSFQGLGEKGLELLAEAREETGLPIVTEVMSSEQVNLVTNYADILQIGARNMQNYELLRAVGRSRYPVLLKRGLMSTIEELLMSAEYILAEGNQQILLCERGIRTFEKYTRNTTDINAIPVLKDLTHLPIILDPSHGVGKWEYVLAVARAGVAAGADGLLVEVHHKPENALSDGAQSLKPERFAELVKQVRKVAASIGRS